MATLNLRSVPAVTRPGSTGPSDVTMHTPASDNEQKIVNKTSSSFIS